jgi:tetratricopeptide (TPR) repeat protein
MASEKRDISGSIEMGKKVRKTSIVDFATGKLSPEESLKVLEYVERNPDASKDLDVASGLLNVVALQGKEVFESADERVVRKSALREFIDRFEDAFRSRAIRYGVLGFAALFIAVIGLVVASRMMTSRYYDLTGIDGLTFEDVVRSPEEVDFARAQQLFAEQRYDETIDDLERFLRAFPHSELADYAHYAIGAVNLLASRRSIAWLFPSFEEQRVMQGLAHLEISARTSPNRRIVEESHWLRAKGFLMLDRPAEALAELTRVELLGGARKKDADQLIAAINRIPKEQ